MDGFWFEIALVSGTVALGHILLGHFEERTPRVKKLVKYILFLGLIIGISYLFGRIVAVSFYFISLLPAIYIHLILLPKKGINGWTGEPKSRYYEYRNWDKNIFKDSD